MNTDRKSILRYLSPIGAAGSTAGIATACALGYDDAERELLALHTLGLVELGRSGWVLTADGRDFVLARMAE